MNSTPEKALHDWLSTMGIRVSKTLINKQLKGHPDYPSLASITDTLDYLKIDNIAAEVEKERLVEIPLPFLAHLKTNGGEFVLVEDNEAFEKKHPVYPSAWSGVIVVAEKKAGWYHAENETALEAERKKTLQKTAAVVVTLAIAVAASLFSFSGLFISLLLVSLAGIVVSGLIVSKDLGIETTLAEKICGKENNCDAVIKAEESELPWGIRWSDVGITWFTSLLVILSFSSLAGTSAGAIACLSLVVPASIVFLIYSVYYQWKVAKKWCRLCLAVAGLLCIQLALLVPVAFRKAWLVVESGHWFFIAGILLLISMTWFYIKNLLTQNTTWENESFESLRFKRNGMIFSALLGQQRMVDTSPWKDDLQLGSSDAPVQVMVACNPYCNPCAKTHNVLHDLLQQHPGKIGLTIRFTLQADKEEDPRTRVVSHMLKHLKKTTRYMNPGDRARYSAELVHQWFRQMDYHQFAARYSDIENTDVRATLDKHENWAKESEIEFTPTIFLNGYELPQAYRVTELNGMMGVLPDILHVQEHSAEPALALG